jgi:phosphoglycerol transferase MdoB-like AlkP superfamily enzyme
MAGSAKWVYGFCKTWAASIIIAGALVCTVLAKLYWAIHINKLILYPGWIVADIPVLLGAELLCALVCFFWPKNWAARGAFIFAALVCAWSVINAGWLIATGTQVLPAVLAPLFFDPLGRFAIIGNHLAGKPLIAAVLLVPSAIALAFFFSILIKPTVPQLTKKHIQIRMTIYIILLLAAGLTAKISQLNNDSKIFAELRYNSQFKAIKSIFAGSRKDKNNKSRNKRNRTILSAYEKPLPLRTSKYIGKYNVVVVVLESFSPGQTEIFNHDGADVPFLNKLTKKAFAFTNCRTPATHTTKALFAIHTGLYPSTTQDYIEASVKEKNYQSIATILKSAGYRSAFFQSAAGTFEARPGLVYNLGFDKFFSREDIADANSYLGYLAADEFELIEPLCNWIKQSDRPFLLTILTSATHDPYEVPQWYDKAGGNEDAEPVQKYRKLLEYTDSFLAELQKKLSEVTNMKKTILCIVGDHGEAFGQHNRYGHARIPYDEATRIFWFIKSPGITFRHKINSTVSSIDVTPTILNILGFNIAEGNFDGTDALGKPPADRLLFFTTWMNNGPAGFVTGRQKFIYDPTNELVSVFDTLKDPDETAGRFLTKNSNDNDMENIVAQVQQWQNKMLLEPPQNQKEKYQRIFDNWLCQTDSREPKAVYNKQ